jgi:hypothetical protein
VRPNIEAGIGFAIGVEFLPLASGNRSRLLELFPRDPALALRLPARLRPHDAPSVPPAV